VVQPIKDAYVKSAKVQIDPAKRDTGVLTCELIKPPAKGNVAPASLVQLELTQQRQGAKVTKSPEPLSINLAVPGTTLVPLPALQNGWEAKSRKMTLALQQDSRPLAFYDGTMPQNATVVIGATTYVVNAVEQNGQLRIDVVGKGATNVIGN
jgi:hypothetical protein